MTKSNAYRSPKEASPGRRAPMATRIMRKPPTIPLGRLDGRARWRPHFGEDDDARKHAPRRQSMTTRRYHQVPRQRPTSGCGAGMHRGQSRRARFAIISARGIAARLHSMGDIAALIITLAISPVELKRELMRYCRLDDGDASFRQGAAGVARMARQRAAGPRLHDYRSRIGRYA